MQNIVTYFNQFLSVIFGSGSPSQTLRLLDPFQVISYISSSISADSSFEYFLIYLIRTPSVLFSVFVWTWFAILTINLLIIFPYHWIRSVIRRCRAS